MELYRYCAGDCCFLILHCPCRPPNSLDAKLMTCRSLTTNVDALLLGPIAPGPSFPYAVRDLGGQPLPQTEHTDAAFQAFLRDAGYLSPEQAPGQWRNTGLGDSLFNLLSL